MDEYIRWQDKANSPLPRRSPGFPSPVYAADALLFVGYQALFFLLALTT